MVDLNKPITMPGHKAADDASGAAGKSKALGRSSKGNEAYPTKTTINLMACGAESQGNTVYTILAFVAAVILIGIFCKICVVDPLASSSSLDSRINAAQSQLDSLKAQNADFSDVSSEYEKYVVKGMTSEESSLVERSVAFDLIQDRFDGVGHLSSVALSGNRLTITLLGADMSSVSNAVAQLESDSRVSHVTVSTAQGQDTTARSATITVLLKDAQVASTSSSTGASTSSSSTSASTNGSSASSSASNAAASTGSSSASNAAASTASSSKGGN